MRSRHAPQRRVPARTLSEWGNATADSCPVSAPVAFEQAAAALRQRDRAFLFIHGHALDESLILEVSEIAGALVRVTKIALRDHPKRADRAERPRLSEPFSV